jgi:hypothetical protein
LSLITESCRCPPPLIADAVCCSLTADDVPNTASGSGSGSIRVRWLILTQALSAAADC